MSLSQFRTEIWTLCILMIVTPDITYRGGGALIEMAEVIDQYLITMWMLKTFLSYDYSPQHKLYLLHHLLQSSTLSHQSCALLHTVWWLGHGPCLEAKFLKSEKVIVDYNVFAKLCLHWIVQQTMVNNIWNR